MPGAKLCVDVLELRLQTTIEGTLAVWSAKEIRFWAPSSPPRGTQSTPVSTCQASEK